MSAVADPELEAQVAEVLDGVLVACEAGQERPVIVGGEGVANPDAVENEQEEEEGQKDGEGDGQNPSAADSSQPANGDAAAAQPEEAGSGVRRKKPIVPYSQREIYEKKVPPPQPHGRRPPVTHSPGNTPGSKRPRNSATGHDSSHAASPAAAAHRTSSSSGAARTSAPSSGAAAAAKPAVPVTASSNGAGRRSASLPHTTDGGVPDAKPKTAASGRDAIRLAREQQLGRAIGAADTPPKPPAPAHSTSVRIGSGAAAAEKAALAAAAAEKAAQAAAAAEKATVAAAKGTRGLGKSVSVRQANSSTGEAGQKVAVAASPQKPSPLIKTRSSPNHIATGMAKSAGSSRGGTAAATMVLPGASGSACKALAGSVGSTSAGLRGKAASSRNIAAAAIIEAERAVADAQRPAAAAATAVGAPSDSVLDAAMPDRGSADATGAASAADAAVTAADEQPQLVHGAADETAAAAPAGMPLSTGVDTERTDSADSASSSAVEEAKGEGAVAAGLDCGAASRQAGTPTGGITAVEPPKTSASANLSSPQSIDAAKMLHNETRVSRGSGNGMGAEPEAPAGSGCRCVVM